MRLQGPHPAHLLCPTTLTSGLIVLPWGGGCCTPTVTPIHILPQDNAAQLWSSRGPGRARMGNFLGEPNSRLAVSQKQKGWGWCQIKGKKEECQG